jgi:hypothetical protein
MHHFLCSIAQRRSILNEEHNSRTACGRLKRHSYLVVNFSITILQMQDLYEILSLVGPRVGLDVFGDDKISYEKRSNAAALSF